ncbi:MAG: tetratricopeptide repeat protein [Bryobacteraceae bacterium]
MLALALTGMLGPAPARMFGQAAAPSSTAPQKNWKDRMEYDQFVAIQNEKDAKARLGKLQQWEKDYPTSEWASTRRTLLLTTYAAVNDGKNVFEEAKQILAMDNPKDFTANYYIMLFTQPLYGQNQSPDILDLGEKAAKSVLDSLDTPPPGVAADQWSKLRPQVEVMAHKNLGFIAMQKKDWAGAEAELQKALALTPNDATVDYQMGTSVASEKKVDRIPVALFYFARAATLDGELALPAAGKQQAMTYVQKQYKNYHGSDEGFNDLVAAAKANPMVPKDFTIKNANDIEKEKFANEEEYNKAHPSEALWASLKMALTAPDGDKYWEMMKGSMVPTLKGRVVKIEPALKPKTIVLAMEDKTNNTTTADATLKFEMPLAGKVDEGTELTFEGVADSFTGNPFMIVFTVDKDNLHGWTGKNEPAPVHHRRPAAKQ